MWLLVDFLVQVSMEGGSTLETPDNRYAVPRLP